MRGLFWLRLRLGLVLWRTDMALCVTIAFFVTLLNRAVMFVRDDGPDMWAEYRASERRDIEMAEFQHWLDQVEAEDIQRGEPRAYEDRDSGK